MEGNCQSSCQSSFNNYVHLVYILIKFSSCTYHVYCQSTEFKPKSKVLPVISIVSIQTAETNLSMSFACSSWSIVTESKVSLQIYFSWSLECLQNVISLTILHVGTSQVLYTKVLCPFICKIKRDKIFSRSISKWKVSGNICHLLIIFLD